MLISNAYAQAAGAAPGGFDIVSMLPLLAILVLFYFMLIRPQAKRAKEHKAMLDALQKGDEVVTAGGIAGRVTKVGESYLSIEIAQNVEVKVQRPAVQTLLPKGTLKSLD